MKNKFADSVLKKIHAKKITPRERSYFIAKTILHIFAGIIFLAFGMISIALLWHLIHNFDFLEFIWERPNILAKLLWFGVPLFWMILAVILWLVTEQVVQRTDKAYRIPFWVIGLTILLIQIFGGFILEQSRVGERLDVMFEKRMEWYNGAERINRRFERMPENGFLAGTVLQIKSDTVILLNDRTNKEWNVQLEKNSTFPFYQIKEGINIRMIGEMIGENEFLATFWRPARKRPLRGGRGEKFNKDSRFMPSPLFNRLRHPSEF